jgi:hypothetical protein
MLTHPLSRKLILLPIALLATSSIFCNLPGNSDQSTPSINVTQAYQTVEARLTQAAEQATATLPSPTSTQVTVTAAAPLTTPSPAPPTAPPSTQTPAKSCDQAGPGSPIDVTVPDDTVMQPGQAFTKIWRLQNTGTCTWTEEYTITYFSGEQMGAPASVPLRGRVEPGQSVDIAVDMIAPLQAGKYQGNWKLRNASNVLFGIGPDGSAPFWVRIIVAETSTSSPTASTSTPTATSTVTPPSIHVSGRVTIYPGSKIDLDTLGVNSGNGEDLSYESDADGRHLLVPLSNVLIARYGENQPTLVLCQSANLSDAPITVEEVSIGTYLCYRTNQGLPGTARLSEFSIDNYALTLDILTWSLP